MSIDPNRSQRPVAKPSAKALSSAEVPATISLAADDSLSLAAPQTAERPVPQRLGRFEIRAQLGGGAFGEVFRAHDPKLDREIALKIARPQRLDDPADLERFFREARAAAQFQHPHIVPVYEVGRVGTSAYLVAALVEGETLASSLSTKKYTFAATAQLVLQLADALHYAHVKGIFHRDIKPGNVLLDKTGKAYLTDFGLARRLEGETLRTQEGDILGTPAYMSPEQACGDSRNVDARSDLYSLGVILYEMLCRRRPFDGGVFDVLQKVQKEEPTRPRLIDKHIPVDLEAICLKALAKRPDDRYRSVEHFAEDLQRWQRNLPVEARRISPVQRVGKWIRRHPLVTAGMGITLAAVLTTFIYFQTLPGWLDLHVSPANAIVKLGAQTVPVADGRALRSFPPGRYELTISADDHEPQTRDVLLVRGRQNAAVVSVSLEPCFGYVSLDSKPANAKLVLKDAAGKVVASGVTPFHSKRIPTGNYQAELDLDLYEKQSIPISVPKGDKLATLPSVELKALYKESAAYDFMQHVASELAKPAPDLNYTRKPCIDVLTDLTQRLRIEITYDSRELENWGVPRATPVTYKTSGESIEEALDRIFAPYQLAFTPIQIAGTDRFRLHVTTAKAREANQMLVLHSVRDLVGVSDNYDPIIDEIKDSISPNSWDDVGGPGSIKINKQLRALNIANSWSVHRQIMKHLDNVRQARISAVAKDLKSDPQLLAALATIERLGGKVTRDQNMLNHPITGLSLVGTAVNDSDLESLPPLPELGGLNVMNTSLTGSGLKFLRGSPKLRVFRASSTKIDDAGLKFVAASPVLHYMELNFTLVGDNDLAPLANHSGLDTLRLHNTSVGDGSLKTLASLPRLRMLSISSRRITDQGLAALAGHRELTHIDLLGTNTSDACIPHLVSIPKLMSVSLGNGCTRKALGELSQAHNLISLKIPSPKINDAALEELKSYPKLGSVTLLGQQFTDAALPHLEGCPKLRQVNLVQTKLSAKALQELRDRHPTWKVLENGPLGL